MSVDPKGTLLTFEVEEKAKVMLGDVQDGLAKANQMSKDAGTDVVFTLNRKELKFAPVTETTIVVPLSPLDEPAMKAVKAAFKAMAGVKDVDVRDSGGDFLGEVTLVPGKSATLADIESALSGIKGVQVRLKAVQLRPDGTITNEQAQ